MQLLLIRESESRIISRLFVFEFFQGAAIALYFLAAITIFVDHLPPSDLPKVFILSAFLLWLFGFIYNKLEHRLLTKQLIYFVLIFNGACILLFRTFIHLETETWFLYLFLASFNILYLLNNLEFWGLVAILFDVRQGKRLFAIVSAWDGPARVMGYILSILLGATIGTENLLWISAFFMLFSILLFMPLAKSDELKDIAPKDHHHYATQSLQHLQAAVTANKLIRNAAFVSFFSFCFYLVTNYVLYGYVKKQFHSDIALGRFFAVFLIVSRTLALIIKPLFVNRLLDNLGIRKSLLVAPIVLLILSAIAIFFSEKLIVPLHLFLVMAIVVDILRSAIQSPVLLTTLQPLPVHQRLKGHTIIKGLMDPFAFLSVGVLLIAIPSADNEVNLTLLSIILLAITVFWIFFALSVDSNYIQTLSAAIRRRLLDERDISVTDNDSLNFLFKKIESGTEDEALTIIQLLSAQTISHEKCYLAGLRHPSVRVKQLTIGYIRSQHYTALLPELKKMLQAPDVQVYLPQLLRSITALDHTEDISSYLTHENHEVSNAVAMGFLTYDHHAQKGKAYNHIQNLFASSEHRHLMSGLEIVGELKIHEFSDDVANLIAHENEKIKANAFLVAGKLGNANMLDKLLNEYGLSNKDKSILKALEIAGEKAVEPIRHFIQTRNPGKTKRYQLYILLGKIGGDAAAGLLQQCLQQFPADEYNVLSILYQPQFVAPANGYEYTLLLKKNMENASKHLLALDTLKQYNHTYQLLIRALELELMNIRDKCLFIFSFLYDREKIRKSKIGFELNTKESNANAFELIDMVVPKEFSVPFMLIFEQGDPSYKSMQVNKFFKTAPVTASSLINDILKDENYQYNEWTKACCLYGLKSQGDRLDITLVEPYSKSDNPILKETAIAVLEDIETSNT
ncbi:MAG: MFS transporter [Bacteroidetes bacterium]|nr:MFS transporter [Bacteroidota bacterium]